MEVSDKVRRALPISENVASGRAWRFTPYFDIQQDFHFPSGMAQTKQQITDFIF